MQPWHVLERAKTPDGFELTVCERGDELAVRVDGQLLMSSRQHGSEETLATKGCERLQERPGAHVAVGGLGLGYTLRATLDLLLPDAQVTVAELIPAIVTWNRGVLGPLAGRPLDDPRVTVALGDVRDLLRNKAHSFDAILLDVDNGPAALTSPRNQKLYAESGLELARQALRPGGTLAVWSASHDPKFVARVEKAGFRCEVVRVAARGTAGVRHVLFLARTTM